MHWEGFLGQTFESIPRKKDLTTENNHTVKFTKHHERDKQSIPCGNEKGKRATNNNGGGVIKKEGRSPLHDLGVKGPFSVGKR